MKNFYSLLTALSLAVIICISGCLYSQEDKDVLFQTSTIDALLDGHYDGEVTFGELKEHGGFGIGTFNGLDGEMIGINDRFYQIKTDGKVYPVSDSAKTPFAVVTSFEPDTSTSLNDIASFKQLRERLDGMLPTENIFYAIKIDGVFEYIKTRSVSKQERPYPKLIDVVKNQRIFEFHDIKGTIVGFWCPAFVKGINIPGYHLHFITKDKAGGGHLLDCRMKNVKAEIDQTSSFFVVLPKSSEFRQMDLTKEKKQELERVER